MDVLLGSSADIGDKSFYIKLAEKMAMGLDDNIDVTSIPKLLNQERIQKYSKEVVQEVYGEEFGEKLEKMSKDNNEDNNEKGEL